MHSFFGVFLLLKLVLADYLFVAIYQDTNYAPKGVNFELANGTCTQELADKYANTIIDLSSNYTFRGECVTDPVLKTKTLYAGKATYILTRLYDHEDCSGSVTQGNSAIADNSCLSSNSTDEGGMKFTIMDKKILSTTYSDQLCTNAPSTNEISLDAARKCNKGVISIVGFTDGSSSGSRIPAKSPWFGLISIWVLVYMY
jgi:hypothetical protein